MCIYIYITEVHKTWLNLLDLKKKAEIKKFFFSFLVFVWKILLHIIGKKKGAVINLSGEPMWGSHIREVKPAINKKKKLFLAYLNKKGLGLYQTPKFANFFFTA